MRKSIARGENLVTGEVTEFTKFKEDSNVRGIAFIELSEGDKTLYRSEAENLFIDYNEWNAWTSSHSDTGAFFQANNPMTMRPCELHLLYDAENKEDNRLHPRERFNGLVTTQGEGEVVGYAAFNANYSGNDTNRGSRSEALSYSYFDPKTDEMVYRYGFIFDETKLIGKKINKLALSPRFMMTVDRPVSTMATYAGFNLQRGDDNTASLMEFRLKGFPRVSDTWHRICNRQMHGDIILNTPADHASRGNFAILWTDTKKVDLTGYINAADAIELVLGDLDTTDRMNGVFNYSDASRVVFNPKNRKLYYTSPVYKGSKAFTSFVVVEYDVAQAEKDNFPSKRLTPTWTKYFDLDPRFPFNSGTTRSKWFTPCFDFDKNVLDFVYNTDITAQMINIRMNADWTIRDFRYMPFTEDIYHLNKIDDDFYRVCVARAHSNANISFYDESYCSFSFYYLDFNKRQAYRGDVLPDGYSSSVYYMTIDTYTGMVINFTQDSDNSSRSRIYFPTPIIRRPIEYLYIDRIPEVPKTSLQQLKIVYEVRQKVVRTSNADAIRASRLETTKPYSLQFFKEATWSLDSKGFFAVIDPDANSKQGQLLLPSKKEPNSETNPFVLPFKGVDGSYIRFYYNSYWYKVVCQMVKVDGFGTPTETVEQSPEFRPFFNIETQDTEISFDCGVDLKSQLRVFNGATDKGSDGWIPFTNDSYISIIPTGVFPSRIYDEPIKVMMRSKRNLSQGFVFFYLKVAELLPYSNYTYDLTQLMTFEITGGSAIKKIAPATPRKVPGVLFGQSMSTSASNPAVVETTIPLNSTKTMEITMEVSTRAFSGTGFGSIKFDNEVVFSVDRNQNRNGTFIVKKTFVNKASTQFRLEFNNQWSGYTEDHCIIVRYLNVAEVPAR